MSEFLIPEESPRITPEILDKILVHCASNNASDITIQSGSEVLAEIYGKIHKVTLRKITNTEVSDILNFIYGANATTQIFSGKDVDTHFEIRPNRNDRYRFRVNGTGCLVEGHDAIQITFRTIPAAPPEIESLNVEQGILDAMAPEQGTIIVTGPTGSGKSTLLASIIRKIAEDPNSNRKMLTYEAPIEFVYDSIKKPSSVISQSEIPKHLPSFEAGIRNALRRKPGLILVGEARDKVTIAAAIEAALTGHPVYTTLHSNGVSDAIRRMISTFPQEERYGRALDILETLRMIIWQRLIPSTDGKRVALREFLVFDDEIRDRLVSTDVEKIAHETRRILKEKGQPMIVDAKRKLELGLITEKDYQKLAQRSKILDKDVGIHED